MRYAWRRSLRTLHDGDSQQDRLFTGWHDADPQLRLDEMRNIPVVVVLGERGAGKSVALEQERALLTDQQAAIALLDLGKDVSDTTTAGTDLRHHLQAAEELSEKHVLLDSLDEGLSDIPGLDKILLRELRQMQPEHLARIRLRITCRTTRWPEVLGRGLRELWPGEGEVALMALAPLTRQDIQTAADAHGLDGAAFAELVTVRGLTALAEQPVTLIPLLDAQGHGEALPETLSEAYGQACRRLCTETRQEGYERRHNRPGVDHLLQVARWTAAALQFSRSTALVDREPEAGEIHLDTLSGPGVPGLIPDEPCRRHELLHLTESGLFTPVGQQRWVFAHRTYQEHLAAEFLRDRITPAVRAELLWAGSGTARRILPEHEEVAARLAMDDPDLFDGMVAHHAWITLLADLPALPAARRQQAAHALLESARHETFGRLETARLDRLNHPGLAEQLAPLLRPGTPYEQMYLALAIADRCQLPDLTQALLTLAEDTATSEGLRSFALDAAAENPRHDEETLTRLHRLSHDADEAIAASALQCLWPHHLSLTEYLNRLPPGAAWQYVRRVERLAELVTPQDADEALEWAVAVLEAQASQALTALAVLAWSVRLISEAGPDHPDQPLRREKAGRALLALVAHPDVHKGQARTPLEYLSESLRTDPCLRRHLAEYVLHSDRPEQAEELIFTPETGLFPDEDLLHWAERWPDLDHPARLAAQPLFRHRQRPADEHLRRAVETARQADTQLYQATAWWDAPPPEWKRRSEEREQQQRRRDTFDENEFATALAAASTAPPDQVRNAWLTVLAHLYKTADGSHAEQTSGLGVAVAAPSYPPVGTASHTLLTTAGLHALCTAPPWSAADIPAWGTEWRHVPELTAAGLVTADVWETVVPTTDVHRWAGWALALVTMTPPSHEQELQHSLFEQCADHAGTELDTALAACLDRFEPYRLTELVHFLHAHGAEQTLGVIQDWATAPGRPNESWAAVMVRLVGLGDDAALTHVQHLLATSPVDQADRERWITAVCVLLPRASLPDSWPHIRRAFDDDDTLFHDMIDALAADPGRMRTTLGMAALEEADLADFYARLCRREELHHPRPPEHELDVVSSHAPGRDFHDFADALAQLIADKGTHLAADELTRLAASGTAHNPNRLHTLARRAAREAARQQSEPLPAPQLRKLAADHALRVITDEAQLLDVVMEALDHVQEALSGPNGMAILLWSRAAARDVDKMWPAWEEDFSDLVMGLLKIHLAGRQIILNREVQVDRPGSGPGAGRTDIHIQATPPHPQGETLTVVIECKGCWNSGLQTALTEQLVDRYLRRPHTAGIFLVGFFDCDLWESESRERCRSKHTRETIEEHQRQLAEQHSVPVLARVLDCRPPAAQSTGPDTG